MSNKHVHTLIIGSGAAGLSAAVHLARYGVKDLLMMTEGLHYGTSINTGSDKQTYYKLSLCGSQPDSVYDMAKSYYIGGCMHGDLALVEAAGSTRAFMNLVQLGVPFPHDPYGQYVGYKTDHDPCQRATSIGPYTSREMCLALIREIRRLKIPVCENRYVVELLTVPEKNPDADILSPPILRVRGAVFLDDAGHQETVYAENIIFATGGPAGLYRASVYPAIHTGAIGVALRAGAVAQNLPESQFGLASIKFRWNVSGTYMQCIPRFISTALDGSDPREFLNEYYTVPARMYNHIFLKGYQWPLDAKKVLSGGSSMIDLYVARETLIRNRRVWMDFRVNNSDFSFSLLDTEPYEYLERSGALLETPLDRLMKMNPGAVKLYADHGIHLESEPLEVAVCAQHHNGGLAANIWWESVNIKHLFPVGEVNGSHGVTRPGGAALNAGQVGALRAAQYIAARYHANSDNAYSDNANSDNANSDNAKFSESSCVPCDDGIQNSVHSPRLSNKMNAFHRDKIQERMSGAGGFLRNFNQVSRALNEAVEQYKILCDIQIPQDGKMEHMRNVQLCFTQIIFLSAILKSIESRVGSRGSAVVLSSSDDRGCVEDDSVSISMGEDTWNVMPEDASFREKILESWLAADGTIHHRWVARRDIPSREPWFETTWEEYRNGDIYSSSSEFI